MRIEPLTCALGAELIGVDLAHAIRNDDLFGEIKAALLRYRVLFLRDQLFSRADHVAFASRFGKLENHPVAPCHPEHPGLVQIYKNPESPIDRYENAWHTDATWRDEPPMGCVLRCVECPPVGGDTMWANMVLAYESLSDVMQAFLGGLKAIHDYSHAYDTYFAHLKERPPLTAEQRAKTPPVEHPMVRTHPVTGRKALYVNPGFTTGIAGMPREDSQPILDFLFRHSTRPEFISRHTWRVNDMIFWDNRGTMHYALADYDFSVRRHMHRTTVAGDAPY